MPGTHTRFKSSYIFLEFSMGCHVVKLNGPRRHTRHIRRERFLGGEGERRMSYHPQGAYVSQKINRFICVPNQALKGRVDPALHRQYRNDDRGQQLRFQVAPINGGT